MCPPFSLFLQEADGHFQSSFLELCCLTHSSLLMPCLWVGTGSHNRRSGLSLPQCSVWPPVSLLTSWTSSWPQSTWLNSSSRGVLLLYVRGQ